MNRERSGAPRWLYVVGQYFVFFLLIAFVVTCCMLLFLKTLQRSTELLLTQEMIEMAAKLTFANVVLISLLCTAVDGARRWFMVAKPVRRIADAAERIMEGDFSVRIRPIFSLNRQDEFNVIIRLFNRMAEELSGIETLRTEPGYAIVEVSDTGCGIRPEVGAHIFEKFYQGDASHATRGNGLGLALVKRVVDIVEGDISVSSEVGRGSSFTVKIRRAEYGTG